MSLFIPGMKCLLCGLPIGEGQEEVAFAPFVANRQDPLHMFSDGVFHRSCFQLHPLAEQAIQRQNEVLQHGGPSPPRCSVCNEQVTEPDDYFATGFLTDDPENPVFEFNYTKLHKSHFAKWERATDFRRLMTEFLSSDAWEGAQLKFDPLPQWYLPPELLGPDVECTQM